MDLTDSYVGLVVDELYSKLLERDYAQDDPEVVMLTTALTNILGYDNRGERPTEFLLMAAWGEQELLDTPRSASYEMEKSSSLVKRLGA